MSLSGAWQKLDAGLFRLDVPAGWVAELPSAGTVLLHDPAGAVSAALVVVSRDGPTRPAGSAEAQIELQKWINTQKHVQVKQAPRAVPGSRCATATTEGLRQYRPGGPWYRRALGRLRGGLTLWRYWAVVNTHAVLLVSCHGRPGAIEKQRQVLDQIVGSIHLPERDLLTGRRFMETVVSLARTWFPQTSVAIIDDAHLQFGPRNISLQSLHQRYLASPEELSTHVRAMLTQAREEMPASEVAGSWSHAKEHVMPVFLTHRALNNARGRVAHEEWVNGLSMAFSLVDMSGGAKGQERLITRDDLARWNITYEELNEQSLQNLILYSHEQIMEGRRENGCTLLCLARPDRHNAVRILLPELHAKLRDHLGGTFYAAMPTREMLLAFSTKDEEILNRMRAEIALDFHRATEGLSPRLFVVTADGVAGDMGEDLSE